MSTLATNITPVEIMPGRILVVDDHAAARESTLDILQSCGHSCTGLPSAIAALEHLQTESYDIIITDLQMPAMDGLEFVRRLQQRPHGAQIIMITAHASVQTAVQAMRYGAFDYLEKPFTIDQLEQVVERAIERGRLLDRQQLAPVLTANSTPLLIGSSRQMQALRQRIQQVARTNETVLITGESGTGKEMVARTVHSLSERSNSPLISLNCPVLSAQLMESELFGHEKGAFTGADAPRTGRFELADHGTILLDEISEIELPLQAKLLRVLQEKSFERVGSSKTIRVDVRVLATSNRNLIEASAQGRFREDLYYRLAVVPLQLTALRERRDDLPELTGHFLRVAAQRLQREVCTLSDSALNLLLEYHWPGNVRELENLMTRISVLSLDSLISADLLRDWLPQLQCSAIQSSATIPEVQHVAHSNPSMQEMERQLIESTLEKFNGHRAKTAAALGIGVRTLSGKLKLYGYTPRAKTMTQRAS
jgi:DNA-binding NtrC family response regulator